MNHENFLKFSAKHRQHQKEAIETFVDKKIGQCILPTGSGKTRVQIHLLIQEMFDRAAKPGVYVIGAHRIVLCAQLLNELVKVLVMCGIQFDILSVSSSKEDIEFYRVWGHKGVDSDRTTMDSTTDRTEVLQAYKNAQRKKRHLIIVSTYHSIATLDVIPELSIVTCDEAHTTIQDDFSTNLEHIRGLANRMFFFTATPKSIGDDGGMKDTKLYGDILYSKSHMEMINAGEIICPKIHNIDVSDDDINVDSANNDRMMMKSIKESFIEHQNQVDIANRTRTKLAAKLLISCAGTSKVIRIIQDKEFIEFCIANDIRVYSFTSHKDVLCSKLVWEQFVQMDRREIIKEMQALKDSERAIFIHIDILTEGIDLPSITGALILKPMSITKLFQTIGRVLRLSYKDRLSLYSGEITPQEVHKMQKPYGHIIFPNYLLKDDANMQKTMGEIIQAWEVPWDKVVTDPLYKGVDDKDVPDKITPTPINNRGNAICNLHHSFKLIVSNRVTDALNKDNIKKLMMNTVEVYPDVTNDAKVVPPPLKGRVF